MFGLSDGGAHCGVLCDASVPTYMLAYMTRDPRATRHDAARVRRPQDDPRLGRWSTASLTGAWWRPATRPTSTSSTTTRLGLEDPEMVYDLPSGGKRLIQRSHGYRADDLQR